MLDVELDWVVVVVMVVAVVVLGFGGSGAGTEVDSFDGVMESGSSAGCDVFVGGMVVGVSAVVV